MKVPQNPAPNEDLNYDYMDCSSGCMKDAGQTITSIDLALAFSSGAPEGAHRLMASRDAIIALAGLKTAGKSEKTARQLQISDANPVTLSNCLECSARQTMKWYRDRKTGI
jgi:Protein of unknown function (DUF2867)